MRNAQFVSKIAFMCMALMLVVMVSACASAASPTATSVPTVTPTALPSATTAPTATRVPAVLPYPTATPLPPAPDPMRVVYVDGFNESVDGTVFEDLLALLPYNDTTRNQALLVDFADLPPVNDSS